MLSIRAKVCLAGSALLAYIANINKAQAAEGGGADGEVWMSGCIKSGDRYYCPGPDGQLVEVSRDEYEAQSSGGWEP